jgi:predicted nucleic acid-binding protein
LASPLIDTDIFVDHLRNAELSIPATLEEAAYSVVTRAELFSGRYADEDLINRLLAQFEEVQVDRQIAVRAGRIRRVADVTMPDALIAATALEGNRKLITRNVRHFEKVTGLTLGEI